MTSARYIAGRFDHIFGQPVKFPVKAVCPSCWEWRVTSARPIATAAWAAREESKLTSSAPKALGSGLVTVSAPTVCSPRRKGTATSGADLEAGNLHVPILLRGLCHIGNIQCLPRLGHMAADPCSQNPFCANLIVFDSETLFED